MGHDADFQWIEEKLGGATQEQLERLEELYDLRKTTQGDRAKIIEAVMGLAGSIPLRADIIKDIRLTLGVN